MILVLAGLTLAFAMAASVQCPSTLDKIKNLGVFTIGGRPASPPFPFINIQNERVFFLMILQNWFIKH
jgi:ABC-type amino acid transport substrate-binding protein